MIKGMTGFGCADFLAGKIKGTIEVKSLNHRYLDIAYFMPPGFASAENRLRGLLSKHIERGRVTVSIKIVNRPAQAAVFNKETAKTYLQYARTLKRDFKLKGELSLDELIQLPGVVDVRETTISAEELWPSVEKSFKVALQGLLNMRKREGQSLAGDIASILKRMLAQIAKIKSRARIIVRGKKKDFPDEEFLSFQKSCDINEELSRLAHHIDEIKKLLRVETAIGKKFDFIAQEMQRETNTIGAKLQDVVVSNAVIALKSKIEKIREQAQNIE